jgi:hypothetical protein
MVPAPLPVDVTASFAQKAGQDVRVTLSVPDLPDLPQPTVLRLNNGKRNVRAPLVPGTSSQGTLLQSTVAASTLKPGLWTLALVGGEGPERRVQPLEARLLTSNKQPLALLPGPTPETRMPAPRPRPKGAGAGRRVKVNPRVRATMVRSVDAGLSVLPGDVAARYRDRLG